MAISTVGLRIGELFDEAGLKGSGRTLGNRNTPSLLEWAKNRGLLEVANQAYEGEPWEEDFESLLLHGAVPGDSAIIHSNAPSEPEHYLTRIEKLRELKELTIRGPSRKVGVHGMAGVGKSVLAATLARDDEVRVAFPDGVIWVSIEEGAEDLRSHQWWLANQSGKRPPGVFGSIEQGKDYLRSEFSKKSCLVILDNIWRTDQVTDFDVLGPLSRLLITTRDLGIVTGIGGEAFLLDELNHHEAIVLMAKWLVTEPEDIPEEAVNVAKECGYLPLALSVCAAMVRDGIPWADLLEALQEADIEFLDHPHGSVMKSLKVGIDALERENPDCAELYTQLAVFRKGVQIPESAVLALWRQTNTVANKLADRRLRRFIPILANKALIRRSEGFVTFHDLQYDYLIATQGNLANIHSELLEAYSEQCTNGWATGPNDGYFFENLAYHLIVAGATEELKSLLLSFDWLQSKLDNSDCNALMADFELVLDLEELRIIKDALRLSSHVLAEDKNQLAGQMLGRLSGRKPGIESMLRQARMWRGGWWLRPLTPSLVPPGGTLERTYRGPARAIAITPDGTCAVFASGRSLKVWDINTGEVIKTILTGVSAAALTPDGTRAVSASGGETLKVWDLSNGEEIRTLRCKTGRVNAVAVTPDGSRAVSTSWDGILKVWDLCTGEEIRTVRSRNGLVRAVAITPDGTKVVSAFGRILMMWDLSTGEKLRDFRGHSDLVRAVAITPDGTRAVVAFHGTLKVWDLSTGEEVQYLRGHTSYVDTVAVTADGTRVVSGSWDGTLKVWDLSTGKELQSLRAHTGLVRAVAITPDGTRVVSTSDDQTMKVWNLGKGEVPHLHAGHTSSVLSVAITPDGTRVVSGSLDGTLKVCDIGRGEATRTFPSQTDLVKADAATPDGTRAVSASDDHTLTVWDLGKVEAITDPSWRARSVKALAITPDGTRAVSAFYQTLKVWDLSKGEVIRTFPRQTGLVKALAITPDGARAVSAFGGTLKVWDLSNGEELSILRCDNSAIGPVAITPDGTRAVSASWDHTLKVWNLDKGEAIRTLRRHTYSIGALAVTPDGTRAVSASGGETLKVWDLSNGEEIRTLRCKTGWVNAVAVTPDGIHAVSGSADGTLNVWDLSNGEQVATFSGDGAVRDCAVGTDGVRYVAGDASGQVHILSLEEPQPQTHRSILKRS